MRNGSKRWCEECLVLPRLGCTASLAPSLASWSPLTWWTVQRLLERGDQVATFSRSGSPTLTSLAEQFPDRLYTGCLDASKNDKLRQFVAQVTERFGGITHCVANAAIAHEGVLATMRDDQIEEMLAVNLAGSIMLVREAVRQMLLAPAENAPSVVVVSSVVAKTGSQGLSVYAATKAGLEGFAISLARELGPRGIRVNAVAPGFLDTIQQHRTGPRVRR
ncbi:SDR family oxidoreductase [bacterium]|nr:SDR family oxidoreductase [bacterium]